MKRLQGPVICTSLEEDALSFVNNSVSIGEPCSLMGMEDMGQEVLYKQLQQQLSSKFSTFSIFSLFITTATEAKELEHMLNTSITLPNILLVNFSTDEDVSSIVDAIDRARLKHSISFNSVIISDLKSLYSAYLSHKKSLTRSLFPLIPLNKDDSFALLGSFEQRFEHMLTQQQKQESCIFSGGHMGLLKSLFLLYMQYPHTSQTPSWLIQQEAILQRLSSLANELPYSLWKKSLITIDSSHEDAMLLQTFGYMKNGAIFTPLFENFIREMIKTPNFSHLFSEVELKAFEFLRKHLEEIVGREKIAEELWQDSWEEKYSDWAIDQTIHRIREKLASTSAPFEIVTKKGEGFYLREKTTQ